MREELPFPCNRDEEFEDIQLEDASGDFLRLLLPLGEICRVGLLEEMEERVLNAGAGAESLWEIIGSFHSGGRAEAGLPLGNLTSQLLVNVSMNAFDQFAKRTLNAKHYIRYADDFVVLHHDWKHLEQLLPRIAAFLEAELKLSLHPLKVRIKTPHSGVDFLGWVHFPDHRVLRTATKKRMLRTLHCNPSHEAMASYLGLLKHGNAWKLQRTVDHHSSLQMTEETCDADRHAVR